MEFNGSLLSVLVQMSIMTDIKLCNVEQSDLMCHAAMGGTADMFILRSVRTLPEGGREGWTNF